LYVLFVPLICLLFYRQKLSPWVFPAAFSSLGGLYLLVGGHLDGLSSGDVLVIGSALGFAVQVVLVGRIMADSRAVFTLCAVQYAAVALIAFIGMSLFESPTRAGLAGAFWQIAYAGAISGGIAYTLQVVAQRFTPAPDSAIILSGEALFAAIAGAWLMGDRLSLMQYGGCALIAAAILLVELAPALLNKEKPATA
jgi:drug/metabolite transporter (DMT)-like permease